MHADKLTDLTDFGGMYAQKFQQDKKPSNLKVLTCLDDAKTFGSQVRNEIEVKFKFENSDKKDVNTGRTEQKK